MPKQPTMVYRKPTEGNEPKFETAVGTVEYRIFDLDDADPAPDGWCRSYEDALTAPPVADEPKKTLKPKDKPGDGNSN